MSIRDARKGLEDCLRATGLRVYRYWPNTPNPPAALIKPTSGNYRETFEVADATVLFDVVVIVPTPDLERAQEALDLYLETEGERSVSRAINADPNLGGKVSAAVVTGFSDYDTLHFGDDNVGADFLGARVQVEVML